MGESPEPALIRDALVVRVGITGYAQEALGDIVLRLAAGARHQRGAGDALGEVESTKSVSDVYAPLAGEVVARNEQLTTHPGADQLRSLRRGLAHRDPGE